MRYIPYGPNQTPVSVVGGGCMRIADMDTKAADAYVRTALDAGINFFDHADIYGGGRSEEVFGKLFADEPALREKLFLQSKCAIRPGFFDFSKEYILKSVDGILKRLNTDHLDALLLHRPDALMEPEEVQEAFETLFESGKVLNFGVSNMNPMQMRLLKTGVKFPLCANQVQMSLAHTPMLDAGFSTNLFWDAGINRDGGILEYCRMEGMVVQTWSPLQYGYFEGTFLGSDKYPKLNEALQEMAEKYGVGVDTTAFAWLLRYPAKMQVITGTTTPKRLQSAARAAEVTLSREDWYALYRAAGNVLP